MGRPQSVSDQEIQQACEELHVAGKRISPVVVRDMIGGDLNRVRTIVNDYKAQQGLAARTNGSRPNASNVTEADRQLATDIGLKVLLENRQVEHQANESYRQALEAENQQLNDDMDRVSAENGRLLQEISDLKAELEQEKQDRQAERLQHVNALASAHKDLGDQLTQAQKDFQGQLEKQRQHHDADIKALQKQCADLNERLRLATVAHTEAEQKLKIEEQNNVAANNQVLQLSSQVAQLTIERRAQKVKRLSWKARLK